MKPLFLNNAITHLFMKKQLLFLFFCVQAMLWAQPSIVNPTPLNVCDTNNDGFEVFNLTSKNAEILGTLNPTDYTVAYFLTIIDAQSNTNAIATTYTNTTAYSETIYVRVHETLNSSNFATTSLQLQTTSPPNPGTISGAQNVCVGGSTTFATNGQLGGTWSTSNSAVATVDTASGVVTGISIGTATISYNFLATGGCAAATATRMVNVTNYSAGVISGNRYAICSGGTTFLTSTVMGGTWSCSNTNIATISSYGLVTAISAGVATINYSVYNPCTGVNSIATYTVYTTAPDAGTIWGSQNVCLGYTSNFTTNGHVGGIWSSSNPAVATVNANTGVVTGVSAGTATISYTIAATGACAAATATLEITVGASCPPNLTNDTFATIEDSLFSGNFITATDIDPNGGTLTVTNIPVSGPAHGTIVLQANGQFMYTPNPDFCGTDSIVVQVCNNGSPALCSQQVITMNVQCVNDPPVANDDVVPTPISATGTSGVVNILSNDFDVDGGTILTSGHTLDLNLTIPGIQHTITTAQGVWTYNSATGEVTYNPDDSFSGVATLTYQLCDAGTPSLCDTATITFEVYNPFQLKLDGFYVDANADGITNPGDEIHYNINVINGSNINITNLAITCTNATVTGSLASLAAGSSNATAFTAIHTITVSDITFAQVSNSATLTTSETPPIYSKDPTPCTMCTIATNCINCTYTPINRLAGGETNKITGNIKYTDTSSCSETSPVASYQKVIMSNPVQSIETFTDSNGNYVFYAGIGTFSVAPVLTNTYSTSSTPAFSSHSFTVNDGQTQVQNFCLSVPNTIDMLTYMYPISNARPGFPAQYCLWIKNNGNSSQALTDGVIVTFDDSKMDFTSSTIAPSSIATGELKWNYNLMAGQFMSIIITMQINSPLSAVPVNVGATLPYSLTVLPTLDAYPSNNQFSFNQPVVGSYDPNIITCIEGSNLPIAEIGNYLHYVVDFENTGNYAAEFIAVKIPIDTNDYDINSLQLLHTSHASYPVIENGHFIVFFPNIMLDTGGHGNVLLKIKSKNTLQEGDTVSKRADIFFDYNAPVDTGFANTTFQTLSNAVVVHDVSVHCTPNPAHNILQIKGEHTLNTIELYDVQGRILQTKLVHDLKIDIDLSNYNNGIYFVKAISDKGSAVMKIIKD